MFNVLNLLERAKLAVPAIVDENVDAPVHLPRLPDDLVDLGL